METHIYEPVNCVSENCQPFHSQSPLSSRQTENTSLLFCVVCCLGGEGESGLCTLRPLFGTLIVHPNPWD